MPIYCQKGKNNYNIYCYIKYPSHSFLLLQGFPGAGFIRKAGNWGLGDSVN